MAPTTTSRSEQRVFALHSQRGPARAGPRSVSKAARIAEAYRAGASYAAIADRFGINKNQIRSVLLEQGVNPRPARRLHPLELEGDGALEAAVVASYESGASQAEVSRQLRVSPARVAAILSAAGVERHAAYKLHHRKYSVDHTVFEEVTSLSAYWMGFLMADGCVYRGNRVQVSSQLCDLSHLARFQSFAGSNHPIKTRDNLATVSLHSPKLVADLAEHGITPRKSYGARASRTLATSSAFWLGVIDGDGTIGVGRAPYISLCGSRPLMEQYTEFLAEAVLEGRRQRVTTRSCDSLCFVRVEGDAARRLAELLYRESPVCLPRKADKADAALRYRSCHSERSFAPSKSPEIRLQKRELWQGTRQPRHIHVARLRELIEGELLPKHGFAAARPWRPSQRSSMVAYEARRGNRGVLVWVTPRPEAELPRSVVARRHQLPTFVLHVSPAHPQYSWAQEVSGAQSSKVPMGHLRKMKRELAARSLPA